MRYVVCYDVSDDSRRDRVAGILLDYGRRIQKSVFLATLDEPLLERMMERLAKAIDGATDCVHVFVLCAACGEKGRVLGAGEIPEERPFYVV